MNCFFKYFLVTGSNLKFVQLTGHLAMPLICVMIFCKGWIK